MVMGLFAGDRGTSPAYLRHRVQAVVYAYRHGLV
ncbi:hypothetical protein JOF55_003113 [Haloactinomyces albus]|uniref:Uncharacterized protein n=1 Tax=Haloactinomyces albus TaxID=1352928 RepID=A0AAE3ZGT5_9ACTN|nr:hypothetical protein [Haloactinomyces albus]